MHTERINHIKTVFQSNITKITSIKTTSDKTEIIITDAFPEV